MPPRAMADDARTDDPEAGAPIGKDTLDPELISLRRPAPRIGAIAAAAVPIVSAVGHEVDITLCDLAADRRASVTTSAKSPSLAPKASTMGYTVWPAARLLRNSALDARALEWPA